MKGIILAGGSGTRLSPLTLAISKQLLPVYNKPLIYYSLSILMLMNINDILIITTPRDADAFKNLLGTGRQFGINLYYELQENPEGIPQAFILAESFIGNDNVTLILGDNIFYGANLVEILSSATDEITGATIFCYPVDDPSRFGVLEVDETGGILSFEEKPEKPKSNLAVTGLYIYDSSVVSLAKKLSKSDRGEYEITDLNNLYLRENRLRFYSLTRGFAWLDAGTFESLFEASSFVKSVESRQGFLVSAPEEIAFRNGWISKNELRMAAKSYNNSYGRKLMKLIE